MALVAAVLALAPLFGCGSGAPTAPAPLAVALVGPDTITLGASRTLALRALDGDSLAIEPSHTPEGRVDATGHVVATGTGTLTVTVRRGAERGTVALRVLAPATPPYRLTVRSAVPLDPRLARAMNEAVARWERALPTAPPARRVALPAGFCSPRMPAMSEIVHGTVIWVDTVRHSGRVLATAGPCVTQLLRTPAGSVAGVAAVVGRIHVNSDALDYHSLVELLVHEVGHVLGVGTLWDDPRLPGGDAWLTPRVQDAWALVGGTGTPAVEPDAAHWSERVFGREVLTPLVDAGAPLAWPTLAALAAQGLAVDYAAADRWRAGDRTASLDHGQSPATRDSVVRPRLDLDGGR